MRSADWVTTAAGATVAKAFGEYAEDGDFVREVGEQRVFKSETGYVWEPAFLPDGRSGTGTVAIDVMLGAVHCSDEITEEIISCVGCSICQGKFCGAREVRSERSFELDKSKRREARSAN